MATNKRVNIPKEEIFMYNLPQSTAGPSGPLELSSNAPTLGHHSRVNLDPKAEHICVAKYWVIKNGLAMATGLGIAVWIVVAFGGIVSLLVNSRDSICINTAAGMITAGVTLSAVSAILYTKVIGYCRTQELSVSYLARKLALGEGGGPALVALKHLERPMEVMAPLEVIERARIRSGSLRQETPVLQFTRGMTLRYGCTGRDGKTTTVYVPDPNAPIDEYPRLKASVATSVFLFYVGVGLTSAFIIAWVSAYPDDRQTLNMCIAMEVVGGFLSLVGVALCIYTYALCLKYEIEDSADLEKSSYTNPVMTIS